MRAVALLLVVLAGCPVRVPPDIVTYDLTWAVAPGTTCLGVMGMPSELGVAGDEVTFRSRGWCDDFESLGYLGEPMLLDGCDAQPGAEELEPFELVSDGDGVTAELRGVRTGTAESPCLAVYQLTGARQ